ncbi:major facilitator superfamily domain-containing protein [Phascolomyces articulosus]|uniref:Major facilitator superfamily domain-containing protein n=1 Tax=Phascolomyces articulosus TaxID=60185 RepID=A0AAD5KCD2_9FUNG|nr:major facilitator superfamily domain-containing protein [Phascolomyces articulosus]
MIENNLTRGLIITIMNPMKTEIKIQTESLKDVEIVTISNKNNVCNSKRSKNNNSESSEEELFVYSPEEKKLLKKMNFITAPFIFIIVFFQYLDKITLNFSAVMNLFEDTNISENEYGLSGAMYYIGFLIFLFPNQYFMHRFQLSKYLGVLLLLWGASLACTALATSFAQLAVLRCLLGFFESGAVPCIMMLIGLLYRRSEQPVLFSIIPSTMALGGAMGGLIGYGFLNMGGISGLSAWRWYMVVLGCTTSAIGFVVFIFLPDKADSRWYRLTSIEKEIIKERIQDSSMVQQKIINYQHILEALKETRLYCFILVPLLLNMVNGAMGLYSTLIIKTLGHFTDGQSILLSIPASVVAIILISFSAYLNKRFNENCYIAILGCMVTILGLVLLIVIPEGAGILVGVFLAIIGPQYSILLALTSINISGYTKKSFYVGATSVTYCVGNFIGPMLMQEKFAPRYALAMVIQIGAVVISGILIFYVRWTYKQDNKKRHQQLLNGENKELSLAIQNSQEADLTDKNNPHFVYRL